MDRYDATKCVLNDVRWVFKLMRFEGRERTLIKVQTTIYLMELLMEVNKSIHSM